MKCLWVSILLAFGPPTFAKISQTEFENIITHFDDIYSSKLQNELNLTLRLESYWNHRSVITSSQARIVGDEAIVFIDGDLAKEDKANASAVVLMICHEFGHIYHDKEGVLKLTKEGTADYFSAQCAMDFLRRAHIALTAESIPSFMVKGCIQSRQPINACLLVASGIGSFSEVTRVDIQNGIDERINDRVRNGSFHPQPMCRIKTFIAGLLGKEQPSCTFEVDPA